MCSWVVFFPECKPVLRVFSSSFLTFLLTLLFLKALNSSAVNSSTSQVFQNLKLVAKKEWPVCHKVSGMCIVCLCLCVLSMPVTLYQSQREERLESTSLSTMSFLQCIETRKAGGSPCAPESLSCFRPFPPLLFSSVA